MHGFIGRQGHGGISSLLSARVQSQAAGQSTGSFGILAVQNVSFLPDRVGKLATHQVMECPSIQISWLDVKVLEGMRRRVNLLVDEFHLHFIRGHRRPPEQSVHPVGSWL